MTSTWCRDHDRASDPPGLRRRSAGGPGPARRSPGVPGCRLAAGTWPGVPDHRVHARLADGRAGRVAVVAGEQAVVQVDGGAVVGVAVALVEAAGPLAGCFEVGGDALPVQGGVVGGQEGGAGAVALPAGADGEDGQVVVRGAGQVMSI